MLTESSGANLSAMTARFAGYEPRFIESGLQTFESLYQLFSLPWWHVCLNHGGANVLSGFRDVHFFNALVGT